MDPLVSIITVNYNQTQVTLDFLASLKRLTYKKLEVIVIDNASAENPKGKIEKIFPDVRMIVSPENLGFAGGNNLGIKESTGEYLFFLNNDTELEGDVIEKLLAAFHKDSSLGMVSPKIKFFDNPNVIQYAGFTPVNPFTGRNKGIGSMEIDNGQRDNPGFTSFAHGAAMMVSRIAIEKAGMMPEIFFLYYEELDWCEKIKKSGYKIYYEPSAVVLHKESISVGKLNSMKTYYLTRNRILYMRRNTSKFQFFVFSVFFTLFAVPKTFLKYLIKREFKHLNSFIKALVWNIKNSKYSTYNY